MRTWLIAGNWKMHKNPRETREFLNSFCDLYKGSNEILFFPSAPCLEACAEVLSGRHAFGSQNSSEYASGAYTGEVSAQVVKDLGGKFVLLGHSERRQYFGETDEKVAAKFRFVQGLGLDPMICVGESLAQREENQTESVLRQQIESGLRFADKTRVVYMAYEPVWAIGTGKVANLSQVSETHEFILGLVKQLGFTSVKLLYGGSVKPENAGDLSRLESVHGFLVGGASLEVKSFISIAQIGKVL